MQLKNMKNFFVVSVVICFVLLIVLSVVGIKNNQSEKMTTGVHIAEDKTIRNQTTETESQTETEVQTETEAQTETEVQTETESQTETEVQTQEEITTQQATEPATIPSVTYSLQEPQAETTEAGSGVTLSFVGDVYVSPMMYANYQKNGISGVISEKIQNIFRSVDICMADHEYVSGDLSEDYKVKYQQFTFLTPSEREKILGEFSFDVMSLANNHMMDYGEVGLRSTMQLVHEQGIATVGGGSNLSEAMKPYVRNINGKKIAILSATRVVPQTDWYATESRAGLLTTYETTDRFELIKQEIRRLKTEENYDIVIVYAHWGNDSEVAILDSQVTLGHGYIDAGADLVVGTHTHRAQGMEYYNGKLICYGMSNFLFGTYHSDTMVIQVNIAEDNSITANMLPCSSEGFYTHDLQGAEAENLLRHVESMSTNVKILSDGTIVQK